MKKIALAIVLFLMIASPAYALSLIDNLLYKKDILRASNKQIMVNRLTGDIKYLRRDDGVWIVLEGKWKEQYMKMYNAQNGIK